MRRGSLSGSVSLITIFCVLCLVVFSTLTLSTALREQSFANQYNKSAVNYYEADTKAVQVFNQILNNQAADVDYTVEDDIFRFTIPVSDTQNLEVEVRASMDTKEILSWRTAFGAAWETDEFIEIWDGT